MSDETPKPTKSNRLPLFIGIFLGLLGAAGGFAVSSGLVFQDKESSPEIENEIQPAAFVAIDPILISLAGEGSKVLRFTAQMDVSPSHRADIEILKPRIVDVLNSYLRAVHPSDFEDPSMLPILRGHMLRRIELVVGEGRVNDLLIMELIIN